MLGHRHRHRSPGRIKEEKHRRQKRLDEFAFKAVLFFADYKRIPLLPVPTPKARPHVRGHEAEHGIRGRTRSRREPRRPYPREARRLRSLQPGRDGASVATVKIKLEDSHHRLRGRADTELTKSDASLDTDHTFPDDPGEDVSDGFDGDSSDEEAGLAYEGWQEKVTDPKFELTIHSTLENDPDLSKSQQASTDIESEDSDEFDDNHDEENPGSDTENASSLDSDLDFELAPGLVADHGSDHDPDVDSDLESYSESIASSHADPIAELEDLIDATLGTEITSPDASTSKPQLIPEGCGFTPHQDFGAGHIAYIPYRRCEDCPKGRSKLECHWQRDKRHRGEGHYLVIYETKEDDGRVYANGFTCTSLGKRKRTRKALRPGVVRKFIRLHGGEDDFRPTTRDEQGNPIGEPAELYLEEEARMKVETYVETKPKSFWTTELKDFKFEHETALVRHRLTPESLEHLLHRTIRSRNSYCGRPRSRDR